MCRFDKNSCKFLYILSYIFFKASAGGAPAGGAPASAATLAAVSAASLAAV